MRTKSVSVKVLTVLAVASAALSAAGYVRFFEHHRAVSFKDVASGRAQLVDGIESYLSVQAFMPELKKRALAFEVEYPRPAPRRIAVHHSK